MKKILLSILAILMCASTLLSCTADNTYDGDDTKTSKEYKAAMELIEDGKYEEAYEALLKLEDDENAQKALENFVFGYDKIVLKASGQEMVLEYEYDKNGNFIKQTAYTNGELTQVNEIEYNDHGDIAKATTYLPDGTVDAVITYTYEYDANGNMTQRKLHRKEADREVESITKYYYNDKNLLVKEESESVVYENTYDDNGFLVKTSIIYGDSQTPTYVCEYENDSKGNHLKETTYNSAGEVYTTVENEYDNKGNLVKLTQTMGSQTQTGEYEYIGLNVFYVEKS